MTTLRVFDPSPRTLLSPAPVNRLRTGPLALAAVVVVLAVVLAVVLGPRARFEGEWVEPELGDDLDDYVAASEARFDGIRAGDRKGIVWLEPDVRGRTAVSVVYLHGFSADRHEVEPLVSELARDLSANAFFTRLRGHGHVDGAPMGAVSVQAWLEDVAEAVGIGERLGERVVLVGTSTGGTLAAWAAAQDEARDRLAALVLLSPNFHPRDRSSRLLLWPWGGYVARAVVGPERCFEPENEDQRYHWTTCYPTRALLPMMALVEHVRTMDLGRVRAPLLVLYAPDDIVVDAEETERLVPTFGSRHRALVAVPSSEDPAKHILAGDIMSPGSTGIVLEAILDFLSASAAEVDGS